MPIRWMNLKIDNHNEKSQTLKQKTKVSLDWDVSEYDSELPKKVEIREGNTRKGGAREQVASKSEQNSPQTLGWALICGPCALPQEAQ